MSDQKAHGAIEKPTRTLRIVVDADLWELLEEVGVVMDAAPKWCFNMMLKRISHMVSVGQADVLGFEFARARQQLDMKGKFGQTSAIPIDLLKLHRSDKLKSGYVGVYANGKGFRCVGRAATGNTLAHIGTYPTAEEAAWARYLHYQKHGFPYGDYADRLDRLQKIYNDHTAAQVRSIAQAEIEEEERQKKRLPPQQVF